MKVLNTLYCNYERALVYEEANVVFGAAKRPAHRAGLCGCVGSEIFLYLLNATDILTMVRTALPPISPGFHLDLLTA